MKRKSSFEGHTGGPLGGEGSLGGVGCLITGSGFGAGAVLRAGGGAGGAPLPFGAVTGLSDRVRDGGATGGGGGGARFRGLSDPFTGGRAAWLACCSRI